MIEIKNLSILKSGVPLISGSDFVVYDGEIVGLFGESGTGKSVFSLFLLGLLNSDVFSCSADSAFFRSNDFVFDFLSNDAKRWCSFRSSCVSMVFQDPSTSLNPTQTCGKQVVEVFKKLGELDVVGLSLDLFEEVGLVSPKKVFNSFPHELSGGQKQRVVIAIALASNPRFLIADEPTTALDPSVQKSVLDLLVVLKKTRGLSVVLISHNIDLINHFSDRCYLFFNSVFFKKSSPVFKKRFSFLNNILSSIKGRKHVALNTVDFYKPFLTKKNLFNNSVFELSGVSVYFNSFCALNNVSFSLSCGDCFGVVGGSGSGKTTLGRVLCGLEKNYSGSFDFFGDFSFLKNKTQLVYQDPFYSFNPKYSVGDSVSEVVDLYNSGYLVSDLFKLVSLSPDLASRFPHELSGGQKQRVSIARVLASNPSVIIFDESISALDIETQFSVLELIRFINSVIGISVVFISHDINSVYYLCNKILVLKNGSVVDFFDSKNLFSSKRNFYTKSLISDSNFLKK